MSLWELAPLLLPLIVLVVALFGLVLLPFLNQRRNATSLLAVLLFTVALITLFRILGIAGSMLAVYLHPLVLGSAFLHGPIFYLYTRASLIEEPAGVLLKSMRWAIIPPVLATALMAVAVAAQPWLQIPHDVWGNKGRIGDFTRAAMLSIPLYNIIFVWPALREVRRYAGDYEQLFSRSTLRQELRPVLIFLLLCSVWMAIPLVIVSCDLLGKPIVDLSSPAVEVPVLLMVYFVFQHALNHPARIQQPNPTAVGAARQSEWSLPPDERARIAQRIRETMEEDRMYLEEDLSLATLAGALGVPAYVVSHVINREFEGNFFSVVNRYRVSFASELLQDPDFAKETVLTIGFRAGFNSKAAFNRVFKEQTGLTPTEYRSRALAERQSAKTA